MRIWALRWIFGHNVLVLAWKWRNARGGIPCGFVFGFMRVAGCRVLRVSQFRRVGQELGGGICFGLCWGLSGVPYVSSDVVLF